MGNQSLNSFVQLKIFTIKSEKRDAPETLSMHLSTQRVREQGRWRQQGRPGEKELQAVQGWRGPSSAQPWEGEA